MIRCVVHTHVIEQDPTSIGDPLALVWAGCGTWCPDHLAEVTLLDEGDDALCTPRVPRQRKTAPNR